MPTCNAPYHNHHYEYRFHCVRSAYGCICAYGAAYGVRHCAYRLHIPKMQTADPCPGNQFFSTYHLDLVKPLADVCIYAHTRMQCACNVICSARGAAGRPLRARAANNVPRKDNRERCDDDRKLEIAGKPLDGTG